MKTPFRSNLLNTVLWFMFRRTSSTVGIGCPYLIMALFARLMSTHSLISPDGFGTTQTWLTHGVSPSTFSTMSASWSSLSLFSNFSIKLKGTHLALWRTGRTLIILQPSDAAKALLEFSFQGRIKTVHSWSEL